MKRIPHSALFTLCLLAGVLVLAYLTLGLSPTSRRVPLLVIVPLIGLLLLELKRAASSSAAEEEEDSVEAGTREVGAAEITAEQTEVGGASERRALLWILLLPALAQGLGILAGPALYVLLYARLKSRERWAFALTAAALTTLGLWVLFGLLLEGSARTGIPLLSAR